MKMFAIDIGSLPYGTHIIVPLEMAAKMVGLLKESLYAKPNYNSTPVFWSPEELKDFDKNLGLVDVETTAKLQISAETWYKLNDELDSALREKQALQKQLADLLPETRTEAPFATGTDFRTLQIEHSDSELGRTSLHATPKESKLSPAVLMFSTLPDPRSGDDWDGGGIL